MNAKDKLIFWVTGLVFAGLFLNMVSSILLPFVVALIVAYFLDPAADKLEQFKLSRTTATFVITLAFFIILIIITVTVAPVLYDQFTSLLEKIPDYINKASDKLVPSFAMIIERLDPDAVEKAKESVTEVTGYIFNFAAKLVGNLWNSGLAIVNLLSLFFVTPVVTFYMLRDWDQIVAKVSSWLPKEHAPVIKEQMKEIDRTLSGYIRGQTNVCLLLGMFYAICLTLAGLDFGFFVGLATGILAFIPYVGLLFGFAVGMIIAFFQFGDWLNMSIIATIFLIGQVIEGNFITPKLVGDKVGLHPVWIIFGMLAGGSMFGFLGILLAIPVTAIIGVLCRFALKQYLQSSFYAKPKKKRKAAS